MLQSRQQPSLNRLLLTAILAPSGFVIIVTLVSYYPHTRELLTHGQEHIFLAAAMIAGIIPFAFLMLRIFRRIQAHIIHQNEALERRALETEALLKVGRAVEESLELDKVLPAALEAVLEATTAESTEVWLLDPDDQELVLRHHRGVGREAFLQITRFRLGEGYPGVVASTGDPILAHSLGSDDRFLRTQVKQAGFQTFYGLPMRRSGGRVIGALCVASRDPEALSGEEELHLLQLMTDQISAAAENARLHEEVEILAILTERDRLAREMHDGLAQVLGYVNTKAQAVRELLKAGDMDAAVSQMDQLEASARETYDDVREGILALSSDGRERPLLQSLREYINRFSEMSGLRAELVVEGDAPRLNPGVEVQLLRIVQEALANVRKHAHASTTRVSFRFHEGQVRLVIEDDGQGFEPDRVVARGPWPHLGLQSMRERATAIGASFTLDTAPGRGARVVVEFPERIS